LLFWGCFLNGKRKNDRLDYSSWEENGDLYEVLLIIE
jgi:hypothetical protein